MVNVGKELYEIAAAQPCLAVADLAQEAIREHCKRGCEFSTNAAQEAVHAVRSIIPLQTIAGDITPEQMDQLAQALEGFELSCCANSS